MFKEDYLQFLQSKDSNIWSTIINREIDETATEEIDEETDVQVVADSFRNFFFESQLRKISLNQFPDDEKVYATLWISTPLSSSALSQKMENRKAILETLVDQEISITLHITNEEVVEY